MRFPQGQRFHKRLANQRWKSQMWQPPRHKAER
jgi:hypothetical protein